jgi:hypothetical protein
MDTNVCQTAGMRFPFSPVLLLLMLVLYLLQMIPVLGFLLLFLGSMFWSVALINGAFLGVLIEVPARKLSIVWLLIPFGYLGTYWTFVFIDYQNVSALRAEVLAHNQPVKVPFDPRRQSLVFDNSEAIGPTTHHVPVVYSRAVNEGETIYRATYLAEDPLCDEAKEGPYRNAGIYPTWFHTRSDTIAGGAFVKGYCRIGIPVPPPSAQVLITSETREYEVYGLPVEETVTTISPNIGPARRLRTGKAKPLTLLPAPLLFCADFGSGNRKNACTGFFWRSGASLIDGQWRFGREGDLLASVLGIRQRDNTYDLPVSNATIRTVMMQARDAVLERELANLDRAIADPMVEIGSVPFNFLRNRGDLIEPRLDGIIRAIEFGVANQGNSHGNAQQMFRLLEFVQHDALRPYEPRLMALKQQHYWYQWEPLDQREPLPDPDTPPIIVEAPGPHSTEARQPGADEQKPPSRPKQLRPRPPTRTGNRAD